MNETILLVDDLQMFLEIEKDFFRHAEVGVLTAKNGAEALELLKDNKADLIFMDLQMPTMDGATCCSKIKSDPELRDIPVVLVSSSANEKDKESCLLAGCDYFLTKPAGRDRFLQIARQFIPDIDRRESRHPCCYACSIRSLDRNFSGSLYDLSAEGAYVATGYPGAPGDIIQLSFALPCGTGIHCSSRIIWVNDGSSSTRPKGFGAKFALLPIEAKAALAAHLVPPVK